MKALNVNLPDGLFESIGNSAFSMLDYSRSLQIGLQSQTGAFNELIWQRRLSRKSLNGATDGHWEN